MTTEEYKKGIISDWDSAAWKLLERVVATLNERGIEPDVINCKSDENMKDGKILVVETVYHHNGADDNASVDLKVVGYEKTPWGGRFQGIAKERVPKNASDRVINNRIEKIIAHM